MKKTLFLVFHTIRITLAIQMLCIVLPSVAMEHERQTKKQISLLAKNNAISAGTQTLFPRDMRGLDDTRKNTGIIVTYPTQYTHFPRITLIDLPGAETVLTLYNLKSQQSLCRHKVELSESHNPHYWPTKPTIDADKIINNITKEVPFKYFINQENSADSNAQFDVIISSGISWSENQIITIQNVGASLKSTVVTIQSPQITLIPLNKSYVFDYFQDLKQQLQKDKLNQKEKEEKKEEEVESDEGTSNQVEKEWRAKDIQLQQHLTTLAIFPKEMEQQAQGTITESTIKFQTDYTHFPFISLHVYEEENSPTNAIMLREITAQGDQRLPKTPAGQVDEEQLLAFGQDYTFENANDFADAASFPPLLISALLWSRHWAVIFSNKPKNDSRYHIIIHIKKEQLRKNQFTMYKVIRRVGYTFKEKIDVTKWSWLKIMWYRWYRGYTLTEEGTQWFLTGTNKSSGWLKKYKGPLIGIAGLAAAGAVLYKYKRGK